MLIKQVRLMDPESGTDKVCDILIKDGLIREIGQIDIGDEETINGKDLVAAPGFVDIHVHFRDPGFTYKEDLTSGSEAAACGGYTSVVCMANTKPVMDNVKTLREFIKRAEESKINIYTVSALTLGMKGEELVNMEAMIKEGAVGFSDDGIPNTRTDIIVEAMERAKNLDVPISFHEEDPSLNRQNGINHGRVSDALGVYGAPAISEEVFVARDGLLSLRTGAKVDIQHISSGGTVDLMRYYKKMGAKLYGEVTPHHFSSTEDLVFEKGSLAKMNPPLRREEDRQKIIEGLKDNTISIIATDHAPHSKEEKERKLLKAPSGIIGLETALGLGNKNLVKKGHLSLMELIEKMTINPAKLFNLKAGRIFKGGPADIVIFNPNEEYIVKDFKSKSDNSPYLGEKLIGKVKYTICRGKIVYKN
ncbi:dihydroorotase [Peptoniphilus catoniae]|uniref:dihydroorotase n=1 Tax=Peptoniphilus catoniae TaxID=1660341 RepID=UPI0010FE7038|nr:dihydroorotase [Peptoniphilus catoniae]